MVTTNERLMAFWKHDRFPYFLCGEIEYFNDNGSIQTKEYHTRCFMPILILPYEKGLQIKENADRIKFHMDLEITNIRQKAEKELQDMFKKENIKVTVV